LRSRQLVPIDSLQVNVIRQPDLSNGYVWYKYKGLLLHNLRRSAVSNSRIAGVDESAIMKISGAQDGGSFSTLQHRLGHRRDERDAATGTLK